jgi:hypothetical protein
VRYGAAAPYALLLILAAMPATVMLSLQTRPPKPQEVAAR